MENKKGQLFALETTLVILILLFLLAGCTSELDSMVAECREQLPAYAKEMGELDAEWDDTFEIAASTSRIALPGPVGELQAIRREASGIEPPECMADEHEAYLDGMDIFIGFFLDFMADSESEPDDEDMARAIGSMLLLKGDLMVYEGDPEAYFEDLRAYAATATAEAE